MTACQKEKAEPADTIGTFTSLGAHFPNGMNKTCFTVGQKAYAGMGIRPGDYPTNSWYEYDPQLNVLVSKAPLPGGKRYDPVGFGIGEKGYLGGGQNPWYSIKLYENDLKTTRFYQDFWQYDPNTDHWQEKAALPVRDDSTNALVAVSLQEKGYLLEIKQGRGNLWEYDPKKDQWESRAPLPKLGRFFAIAQKLYCLVTVSKTSTTDASSYQSYIEQTELWEYTPSQNEWLRKSGSGPQHSYFLFSLNDKGYFAQIEESTTGNPDQADRITLWAFDPVSGISTRKNTLSNSQNQNIGVSFSTGEKGYFTSEYRTLVQHVWAFDPLANP
jgi:hypothetical protein